ncbi:hypothetical protein [Polaromonas sp. JS666]|uniref:hypothetical protein n=1 Tax=Polaromonas sp. (strain JS666 / ATCC BAA-500) TaxID=296591 RepID=UPI0000536264|nr:hypothetical protein [Polaromonas sp. JS666]ABE46054.1 hypothetical protein Bpro_4162 [Polaromonas sp. JS666]
MTIEDGLTLIGAVAISFGGGAVIVIGLSTYLADLWAKRTLQREQSALQAQLEEMKHELGLAKSSYDRYLDLVLEYYGVFYRHYRMCQRTANADAHRQPDGKITFTQDEFLANLDVFLVDWAAQEGEIRLLLPSKLLELHGEAIDCFNRFKHSVENFRKDDVTRKAKEDAFVQIESVKSRLEESLREFLRTEKLLK